MGMRYLPYVAAAFFLLAAIGAFWPTDWNVLGLVAVGLAFLAASHFTWQTGSGSGRLVVQLGHLADERVIEVELAHSSSSHSAAVMLALPGHSIALPGST